MSDLQKYIDKRKRENPDFWKDYEKRFEAFKNWILRAPPDHPIDDSQIPEYSLDDLLKDVTADNLHDESDMGRPVGNEEW